MRALLLLVVLIAGCSATQTSNTGKRVVGIVNGKTAAPTDVAQGAVAEPVVGIYTGDAICSGTLISPEIVLTAGHCFEGVKKASDVIVMLHVLNMLADQQPTTAFLVRASGYVVDADYNQGSTSTSLDDLALIHLSHAVPAGTKIATLPDADFDYSKLAEGTAFGFGDSDDRHGLSLEQSGAGTLRYTSFANDHLEVLPVENDIDKSLQGMLAAAADTTAVCSGDSGGPMFASVNGVVSNVVIAVNDAVIPHYEGQEESDFESAGLHGHMADFYKKYPDAHQCLGGLNFFIPVTRRLMWIQTHAARLMNGIEGVTPVPPPPPPAAM